MMEAMFIGQYWWVVIPGIILAFYAQFKLTSAYSHYSQVPTNSGLTGAEAARQILDSAGLQHMAINEVQGHLTDHYDPMKKALFLSSENYHGHTLAAVGVAAHEAGHALQHKAAYAPLHIRMAMVPITGIATQAAFWLFMLGYFMNFAKLATIGIIIFGIITLFQVVTLPVEFNASSRAKDQLLRLGLIDGQERRGVSKVLSAAAMTYVAAMVQSFLQLLQFILIARGNDRD
jgi:Zn-dependent membrane protease YugP